jgi:hypothetical protein
VLWGLARLAVLGGQSGHQNLRQKSAYSPILDQGGAYRPGGVLHYRVAPGVFYGQTSSTSAFTTS